MDSHQSYRKNLMIGAEVKTFNYSPNQTKKNMYCEAIGKCSMPDCPKGLNLEVHHIIPLKQGGDDDITNYILLCNHCHRHNKLHSRWREKRFDLYTYKSMVELQIIGSASADYSDEEYIKVLRNFLYGSSYEVKKLSEESPSEASYNDSRRLADE